MVKFSQDLWDGFDVLNARSEQGVVVLKDITEFLKKRAQLEAEYAKNLAALCKSVPGAGGGLFGSKGPAPVEKETKTLKAALLSIQEEGSRAATGHQDFANKVLNDVVKPLETYLKAKENDRKKATTEGAKRVKGVAEAKAAAEKAKDTYLKAMKEAELATDAHDKAKVELAGAPDNKKFQEAEKRASQKAGPLNDKAKASEAPYVKAVDTTNDVITKTFGEHLPPIIDSLQTLEEERYTALRTALGEYLTAQRAIPTNLEERCQELDKTINAVDMDSDLTEFVDSHKSASTEPEKMKFVPFKEPAVTAETDGAVSSSSDQPETTPTPTPTTATTTTTTDTTTTPAPTPAADPAEPAAEPKTEDNLFS